MISEFEDENDINPENGDSSFYDEEDEKVESYENNRSNVLAPFALNKIDDKAEIEKGKAVHMQLQIWENLLSLRIKLQTSLHAFNQLPREALGNYLSETDKITNSQLVKTKKNLMNILGALFWIDQRLLFTNSNTKHLITGDEAKADSDEEIDSSFEDDESSVLIPENDGMKNKGAFKLLGKKSRSNSKKWSKLLAKRHKDYQIIRKSTLSKWDEKIKMSGNNNMSDFNSSTFDQIEKIVADKPRLIKRTWVKRADFERIDGDSTSTNDPEIFNDDDFYHRLLRELIQKKSINITDPISMSRNWLEIQKLHRRTAKKQSIDTKASKGRKVRYDVVEKLVNFHPQNDTVFQWTNDAKNELFKSLFLVA